MIKIPNTSSHVMKEAFTTTYRRNIYSISLYNEKDYKFIELHCNKYNLNLLISSLSCTHINSLFYYLFTIFICPQLIL